MNTCTCTAITARLTAQCESCARQGFIGALNALAGACEQAARILQR